MFSDGESEERGRRERGWSGGGEGESVGLGKDTVEAETEVKRHKRKSSGSWTVFSHVFMHMCNMRVIGYPQQHCEVSVFHVIVPFYR